MSRTKDAFVEEMQKQARAEYKRDMEREKQISSLISLGINSGHTIKSIDRVVEQFKRNGDYIHAFDRLDETPARIMARFVSPNAKNRIKRKLRRVKYKLRRLKYKLIDKLPRMGYHASID